MTDFLVKRFIKNSTDVNDPAVRTAYGNLAGAVGIFCNVLLLRVGGGHAVRQHLHYGGRGEQSSDASSSVITLVGFRFRQSPRRRTPLRPCAQISGGLVW
ncbi:MAG: hypothetical protein ACLRZH_16850 [Ruthenibacterium lactatiformans]